MYFLPVHSGDNPPAILTIAGSDSGGGAGIQADLKTFTALACYGTSAVTAITAQNTKGVQAVYPIPPEFVKEQIRSVLDDINVTAIKTGMLANQSVVRTVADTLKGLPSLSSLVVDPVCVSTSGHTLLEHDAIDALASELLPLAAVVTPNTREATLLLHQHRLRRAAGRKRSGTGIPSPPEIDSIEDMLHASREAGGHLARGRTRLADVEAAAAREALEIHRVVFDGMLLRDANMEILFQAAPATAVGDVPVVVDVLCEGGDRDERGTGKCTVFVRPFLDSGSTHGTGCTLSAALACGLARGEPLVEAVKLATMYTHECIAASFPASITNPLAVGDVASSSELERHRPMRSDPYPLVRTLIGSNAECVEALCSARFRQATGARDSLAGPLHPFYQVRHRFRSASTARARSRMVNSRQDYLYLKYFARANGLLASKSSDYSEFGAAAETILSVVKESRMHVLFSAQWGVDLTQLESTPESSACTAYGAYIMDIGIRGDAASLLVALAACLLGYGEVGLWLQREANRPESWARLENNPYRKWIEDYSGERYQAAVKVGIGGYSMMVMPSSERIEALALDDPPSPKRLAHWKNIWERCTCLEKQFWDMAMAMS
ncbi:Phosphomethylpyrimidine kinase-domain-containing protein [Russula earlei]|uniref:Phosphomethylpyrimidine kinase-domain-containing protein n=1 Tax=Russula earlei TaxID=71964 RepID=A0ACC0TZE5_9AGAM|nr:Phosphomethylpyrimidine kinase-domain-containing protein [Russula earlei]